MRFSIDSRNISPDQTFIPVKGQNFDGHDFIKEVKAKGCDILDVDLGEFATMWREKFSTKVICITGSSGKTTVKEMLYSVLSQKFKVIKTIENNNNEIGVPLSLLQINEDTDIAIIELGMRALGEIRYLTRIARPDVALITNIGSTHIETLGSRDNICQAKCEIFDFKPLDTCKTYINDSIDYAREIEQSALKHTVEITKINEPNILNQNSALVKSVALDFGLSEAEIDKVLSSFKIECAHRWQELTWGNIKIIDDTYNANPDSMNFAIKALSSYSGRKVAVLGDMAELGENEEQFHQGVDTKGVDLLLTYGQLSQNILASSERYHFFSREDLLNNLKKRLKPGDVVLFKGSRASAMDKIIEELIAK